MSKLTLGITRILLLLIYLKYSSTMLLHVYISESVIMEKQPYTPAAVKCSLLS